MFFALGLFAFERMRARDPEAIIGNRQALDIDLRFGACREIEEIAQWKMALVIEGRVIDPRQPLDRGRLVAGKEEVITGGRHRRNVEMEGIAHMRKEVRIGKMQRDRARPLAPGAGFCSSGAFPPSRPASGTVALLFHGRPAQARFAR